MWGCSALVSPIIISKSTIHKDIPFAILATLSLIVVSLDAVLDGGQFENLISRTDGLMLLGLFAVFMFYTFSIARNKRRCGRAAAGLANSSDVLRSYIPLYHIGIGRSCVRRKLICGCGYRDCAQYGSKRNGSGFDIGGRRNVATGTCHFYRGSQEGSSAIAIGNVVGSNIFNIFFVMGFCATVSPMSVGEYFVFRFRAYAFKYPDSLVFLLHKTDD